MDTSCVIAALQMPVISSLDLLTHMRTEGYNALFIFFTVFPDRGQLGLSIRKTVFSINGRSINVGKQPALCLG
jgi:hypothetical protein